MKEYWICEEDLFEIFPFDAPKEKDNKGWKRVILTSEVDADRAKDKEEIARLRKALGYYANEFSSMLHYVALEALARKEED